MFEKDAVEYREKGKNEGYYQVTQDMEQEALDYIIDESFKDGAEFGYNKANEEHSAEIDVLKRELQAEKTMGQYWHDEYCKAVSKK